VVRVVGLIAGSDSLVKNWRDLFAVYAYVAVIALVAVAAWLFVVEPRRDPEFGSPDDTFTFVFWAVIAVGLLLVSGLAGRSVSLPAGIVVAILTFASALAIAESYRRDVRPLRTKCPLCFETVNARASRRKHCPATSSPRSRCRRSATPVGAPPAERIPAGQPILETAVNATPITYTSLTHAAASVSCRPGASQGHEDPAHSASHRARLEVPGSNPHLLLKPQAAGVAALRGIVVAGPVPAHAQRLAHRDHPASASASALNAVMNQNSPSTNSTSLGRLLAQRSISPSVN
jgi:hypothetical protein